MNFYEKKCSFYYHVHSIYYFLIYLQTHAVICTKYFMTLSRHSRKFIFPSNAANIIMQRSLTNPLGAITGKLNRYRTSALQDIIQFSILSSQRALSSWSRFLTSAQISGSNLTSNPAF